MCTQILNLLRDLCFLKREFSNVFGSRYFEGKLRVRYFSIILSPPPPPHQKIRKTVAIVPEKMNKSSIEILQIRVLSKYN